jgi:peptidoglycan biosynthesis protein MviN/MurJ (putative lipid II flippase)
LFLLTVPLAVVGAAMAWLISYDELSRHYAGRREPAVEALRRALVALAFFLALGAGIALVIGNH